MPASQHAHQEPLPTDRFAFRSRRPLMEEFVDALGRFGADTIDLHQVSDRSALDGFERAEVVQQRTLSRWADALDLLQTGLAQVAGTARPV